MFEFENIELRLDRSMISQLHERLRDKLEKVQKRARARILDETDLSIFLENVFKAVLEHRAGHAVLSAGRVGRAYTYPAQSTLVRIYWWRHARGVCLSFMCARVSARNAYHKRSGEYYITFYSRKNDLQRAMQMAAPQRYSKFIKMTHDRDCKIREAR